MNELKIFEHPDFGEVRTLETNGVVLSDPDTIIRLATQW